MSYRPSQMTALKRKKHFWDNCLYAHKFNRRPSYNLTQRTLVALLFKKACTLLEAKSQTKINIMRFLFNPSQTIKRRYKADFTHIKVPIA